jgi:peptidoglycan hydrolase-like protein with peptidoglycan-binding domain
MQRRRFLVGLGGAGGLALTGGVGLLVGRGGRSSGDDGAGSDDDQPTRTTGKLEIRDLRETTSVEGTLGFGGNRQLALAAHGTLTALPAEGTTVERGGQVAEVDGQPVLLLFGDRPMWRPLPPPDPNTGGPDVEQLEANLIELGYGTTGTLGPNHRWTEATVRALQRWQKALGVAQTGTLELGQVVYEPGPIRVTKHLAEVGAQAGGPVLQVTSTARAVHVELDAAKQAAVHVGDAVQVELPDGSRTGAKVTTIGTVTTSQDGSSSLPLDLTLDDPSVGGDLDEAPVSVLVTTSSAEGVLAAPVQALLALAEGGYAVEKVTGPTTKLVAVTLGPSADGWVQVEGDVSEGDVVVIAP